MWTISDCLSNEQIKQMYDTLSGTEFPWNLYTSTVSPDAKSKSRIINCEQFSDVPTFRHSFISDGLAVDDGHYDVVKPFLKFMVDKFGGDIGITGLHSNLLLPTSLEGYSIPHIDKTYDKEHLSKYDCYTGIFYLNTCEGSTVLYNEVTDNFIDKIQVTEMTKIAPTKGSFVFWEYGRLHSAPLNTSEARFLFNINFCIPKETKV